MEKTLKEVVGEVAKETRETSATTETKPEGISETKENTETKSGEPVYVSGVDISDIPEQDRPRIKDLIEKKAKLLEKGYQPKFQRVAELEKTQADLVAAGLTVEEARTVLQNHIQSKKNPISQEKKEAKKTLDTLIESSPAEQKESLRQLRTILMEEGRVEEVEKLRKEITEMRQVMGSVTMGYQDVKKKEIESQIPDLQKRYGKDLVEKYHDTIVEEALKFNVSPSQVLRNRASDDEIEQAISQKASRKQEKINAVSSAPSGVTASEKIEIKDRKFGAVLRDIIKSKT